MDEKSIVYHITNPYLLIPLLTFFILLYFAIYGDFVFPDEGFYLLASRLVSQGKVLYQDFSYFQGPALPFIYGFFGKFFGFGILEGRLISILFALGLVVVFLKMAEFFAGRQGALLSGIILLFLPLQIHILTLITAYTSLANFLLFLMYYGLICKENSAGWSIFAGFMGGLAVAVRLSFLPVVLFFLVYFIFKKGNYLAFTMFLLTLIGCYTPFFVLSPEKTFFNLITVHFLRTKEMPMWWNLTTTDFILNKIEVLLAVLFHNLPIIILPLVFSFFKKNFYHSGFGILISSILVFFLVHILPKPTWELYFITPILFFSLIFGSIISSLRGKEFFWLLFISSIFYTFIAQGGIFFQISGTPFSSKDRQISQLKVAKMVGKMVKENSDPSRPLFTFFTPIALEAEREVLPGMEMTFFEYFPRFSQEKCQKYGLVNTQMLIKMLREKKAGAVVLSRFTFEGGIGNSKTDYEQIKNAIEQNYEMVKKLDHPPEFRIYLPKKLQLKLE